MTLKGIVSLAGDSSRYRREVGGIVRRTCEETLLSDNEVRQQQSAIQSSSWKSVASDDSKVSRHEQMLTLAALSEQSSSVIDVD